MPFFTFEGPEGSGKTTLIRSLAVRLEEEGREVVVTREPGSGAFGAEIRRLLLQGGELDPRAELFLFLADRTEHVRQTVRPALERDAVVLCDRFADSTVAYQGYGRGLDVWLLRTLNELATGGLKPDLTFLLDLDVQLGLARLTSKDRLDSEPLAFHERVRSGFQVEARLEPGRWRIIDASQAADEVTAAVWAALAGSLSR